MEQPVIVKLPSPWPDDGEYSATMPPTLLLAPVIEPAFTQPANVLDGPLMVCTKPAADVPEETLPLLRQSVIASLVRDPVLVTKPAALTPYWSPAFTDASFTQFSNVRVAHVAEQMNAAAAAGLSTDPFSVRFLMVTSPVAVPHDEPDVFMISANPVPPFTSAERDASERPSVIACPSPSMVPPKPGRLQLEPMHHGSLAKSVANVASLEVASMSAVSL